MFTSDPKTGSTKPAGLVGPEQQTSFALGTGHNVTVYARRAGPGPMERPVGLVAMDRLVEATNGHTQFWAYSERHVEAVLDAQDVYQAYSDNLLSDERAADEIRCCRSRIRMYAKDAEFLPNADGSPANDTWGSLDDFIPWRWRP